MSTRLDLSPDHLSLRRADPSCQQPSIALWATVLCIIAAQPAYASTAETNAPSHIATLDDAYGLKSIDNPTFNRRHHLFTLEIEGKIQVYRHGRKPMLLKEMAGEAAAWSPDGEKLAFFAKAGAASQLFVWTLASDSATQVTNIPLGVSPNFWASTHACSPLGIAWAPDSSRIAFGTRLPGQIAKPEPWSGERAIRAYGPRRPDDSAGTDVSVTDGVFAAPNPSERSPLDASTDDYRRRASSFDPRWNENRLIVADVGKKSWSEIKGTATQYACPSWSPDGKRIAALRLDNYHPPEWNSYRGGADRSEIVSLDLSTGAEIKLPIAATRVGAPQWSPDGTRIATIIENGPRSQNFPIIGVFNFSTKMTRLVRAPGGLAPETESLRWSVDGTHLIAAFWERFANTLWKIDPKTDSAKQLDTGRWHVPGRSSAFAEVDANTVIFLAESAKTQGQLMITGSTTPLYNANPGLSAIALGRQTRFTWHNSRGDEVDGILIYPPDYDPTRRYPVIIDVYPRPAWDTLYLGRPAEQMGYIQASWGYIVFRPLLRNPITSYYTRGKDFTQAGFGVAGLSLMVDDFESGVRRLIDLGLIDAAGVGLYGHSNGGWVANLLMTRSRMISSVIVQSGVSNLEMGALFPWAFATRGADPLTGGNLFDDPEVYRELSPLFRMRDVNIPTLLLLGDEDYFWVPQMIAQYSVLRQEGVDVELVRYANEGHSLAKRSSIEDSLRRQRAFFDRTLRRPTRM
jgi:dipeptidyl aminopeptidase/acylaminoacyl peptidase